MPLWQRSATMVAAADVPALALEQLAAAAGPVPAVAATAPAKVGTAFVTAAAAKVTTTALEVDVSAAEASMVAAATPFLADLKITTQAPADEVAAAPAPAQVRQLAKGVGRSPLTCSRRSFCAKKIVTGAFAVRVSSAVVSLVSPSGDCRHRAEERKLVRFL